MTVPVTTPRWPQPTVDCGPTMEATESRPSPPPSTKVSTTGCHTGAGSGANRNDPTATRQMPAPTSMVSRKPTRRNSRADWEEARGPAERPARRGGAQRPADAHRREHSSRGHGPQAQHRLAVGGQERGGPDDQEADAERGHGGPGEHPG